MSKYSLISIDTIISKLYREIQFMPDSSEADLVEYVGEALDAIGAFAQYEEDICFINIENHRGDLPRGLVEIIQVALSTNHIDSKECLSTTCSISDETKDCDIRNKDKCTEEVVKECWSAHNQYFIPEQRYLDAIYEYDIRWMYTPYFYRNFIPMRLSTGTMNSLLGMHRDYARDLSINSPYEYKILNNQIVTSNQTGTIALAYTRMPIDENGFPMIPDMQEYREAITKYIIYKMSYIRFLNNEPNFRGIYEKLESDWHWYCKQAKNAMLFPTTLDEKQNMKDITHRMLPISNGYYGFFGNINTPENFSTNGRRQRF
jgi:hypothetical protein